MSRPPLRVLLALLVPLLGGCSLVKVAYDNAQPALRHVALDYLPPLEERQLEALDLALGRLHAWHRAEELPRYVALLREARARWADGLSRADAEWALAQAQARYDTLAAVAAEGAAPLLASLAPQQVEGLAGRLRRANERFAEERLRGSTEEQLQRRAAQLVDRLEDWYGPLDAGQESLAVALSRGLPHDPRLRLAERERRQAQLLALLREGLPARELAPRLRTWLTDWSGGQSAEYAEAARLLRERGIAMAVEIDRAMRPAQRARALARLDGYRADLEDLARAAQPLAAACPRPAAC